MRKKRGEKSGKTFLSGDQKLRLLVVIASYGEKNISYLKQIISAYRCMEMEVEIIVLSEAPKHLDPGVKVLVGLPSKNPWSLPFGHQRIFAENADRFDLFIYSEDDVLITEEGIRAFQRLTPHLAADEIAGFMRYEVGIAGTIYLPDVHGSYHWKPESIRSRGNSLVAEFTNEHSAFYLINQEQLKRAIASGGFLREPHEDRYDMLCTAATDIYTSCGFRKVMCVSEFDKFLVHHLSNKYAGKIGLPLCLFKEQIATLKRIHQGEHPVTTLCNADPKSMHLKWFKDYQEKSCDIISSHLPKTAKTVLSIGCGDGQAEEKLIKRGLNVTAFALDSVIGAKAAQRGIEVVYGTLKECLERARKRRFDAVVISNLLHLQPNPEKFLEQCSDLVADGGSLLVRGPNFDRIGTLLKRAIGWKDYQNLRRFEKSGITVCQPKKLKKQMVAAGFNSTKVSWFNHEPIRWKKMSFQGRMGWVTASEWVLCATKPSLNGKTGNGRMHELSIHIQ